MDIKDLQEDQSTVWEKKIFSDKDLADTFECKQCHNIPKKVYMSEKDQIFCKTCIDKLKNENKIKTIKFNDDSTNTMEQIMLESLYVQFCPNNPDDYIKNNKNKQKPAAAAQKGGNNNKVAADGGAVDFGTNQGPKKVGGGGMMEGMEGQEGGGNNDIDDDDVKKDVIDDDNNDEQKDDSYCYDFCNKQLSLLEQHLANECKIKIVSCPFFRIKKCHVNNIKKNELSKHLNKEKVGHLRLLIELINENNKNIANIKDMQKECDNLLTEYKKESDTNLKEYQSIDQQVKDIKKDQNIEDDGDDDDVDVVDDDAKKDDDVKEDDNKGGVYKYDETLKLLKEMFTDKSDNELKKEIDKANGDAQVAMNALLG